MNYEGFWLWGGWCVAEVFCEEVAGELWALAKYLHIEDGDVYMLQDDVREMASRVVYTDS